MAKVPEAKSPIKPSEKSKNWNPQPRPGNPIYMKQIDSTPVNVQVNNSSRGDHQVSNQKKNDVGEVMNLSTVETPCSPKDDWSKSAECDDIDHLNAWKKYVSPDDNLIKGMAQALALIIQAASNPKGIDREKAFYGIQFLSTIKNNWGEPPPNVKGFMEYIEQYIGDDGTVESEKTTQPL